MKKKTSKAQKAGRRAHSGSISPYGAAGARPKKTVTKTRRKV